MVMITKISVIGAGQIGPDIALHFAKSLSAKGVSIVIVDISPQALERAREKVYRKIYKGVETGAFREEQAEKIKASLTFTNHYKEIQGSQLVLEAATEDENIKDIIFKQVELITSEDCIYLSNSSHMQPEVIFRNMEKKSRCLVAHYFFPAEINPVVELVPGPESDPALLYWLTRFYESIGKVPITVKSSYGYAIDPIFEGLCQIAIQCFEKGLGSEKEIDAAAVKALGLGIGPFTALNLTGGNPITAHGLDEMGKKLIPWFYTPKSLYNKNKNRENWNTASRGEKIELMEDQEELLVNEFRGGYFSLATWILDRGIVNIDDLNMACEMALSVKAPFTFMNKLGIENCINLIRNFCSVHPKFPFPQIVEKAKKEDGWKLSDIKCSIKDGVFIITIRRPKVLNALNLTVLRQIAVAMQNVKNDPEIHAVVITGFGTKAFVSGADINMLAALHTPAEGYENSHAFQSVLNYISDYSKPVICAMNGFAFGGGSELAMACSARICKKNLSVLICQPEVNLGFIPGAGGTQRLPRIVGVEKAAEILRTGRSVSSKEAVEIGLILKEAEGDLLDEAVALAKEITSRKVQIKVISKEPILENSESANPKEVDIGHLSKKIDELLVKAIYIGSGLSLDEGLDLESRMFGECLTTEDMKIGLENFKTNGPKAKAHFVHK